MLQEWGDVYPVGQKHDYLCQWWFFIYGCEHCKCEWGIGATAFHGSPRVITLGERTTKWGKVGT